MIAGNFTLEWIGTDADSTDLVYWVQYSSDQGATWSTLAQTGADMSMDVDFATLPGAESEALIRVLVSDWSNTGISTSLAFSVAKKTPVARYSHPDPDTQWAAGEPVFLDGVGYDPDDGNLPDGALLWVSDLDGNLGSGRELAVSTLSEGSHVITLSVTDSDNNPASAEVSLTIATIDLSEPDDEDADADNVADYHDNCLGVANPDQRDTGVDGFGNACDADFDDEVQHQLPRT